MTQRRWPSWFWLLSVHALALASCPSDSAGPPPDAIECNTDADCRDDHIFCNGGHVCLEQTLTTSRGPWHIKTCKETPPPCGTELCDEETRSCTCRDSSRDLDGDGHLSIRCGGDDCDDNDARRVPGAPEVCDPDDLDEDCDPTTFGRRDADGDGAYDAACCNGEICGSDCDDSSGDVHPNAVEACDSQDNDCDRSIDEGVLTVSYVDADGDGFGTGTSSERCAGQPHYATIAGDCDDHNPQLHPGAFRCTRGSGIEICSDAARWTVASCADDGACVPQPDGTGVCLAGHPAHPQCSDGQDNDGDGTADSADPECSSALDDSEAASACQNGVDDDNDGLVDYPDDPGCATAESMAETDPASSPACANGLDDDGDGTADYVHGSGDPGCASASDNSERNRNGESCDNGIDDDGDGASDFPADSSCPSANSDAERKGPCNNGLDDDGDGAADYPADHGCDSAKDQDERGANYPCDNGLDDDGDGAIDYPGDRGCTSVLDNTET